MSPDLVSIIIPVYNRALYIEEALNSALLDSFPNKELVILDDGSTDNGKQVIEQWIANNGNRIPVVFKSRPNKGFIKSLNELVRMSSGQYIVLLDSDDYLINGGIEKRYEYLKQNPSKMMVFADCLLIDSDGKVTDQSALSAIGNVKKEELVDDASIQKFAVLNGFTTGSTTMVNRRIYDVIGPYDETLHSQDYVYNLRVASKNLLGFVNETVSAYRIHANNMSVSYTQALISYENMVMMATVLKDYPGVTLKFYLLANILREIVRIPYLYLKYTLMNAVKNKDSSPKVIQWFANGVLSVLNGVKNLFNALVAKIYLKEYS